MADDATVNITATLLPDEISKSISGSMTVTPDDVNDKWYSKRPYLEMKTLMVTSNDLLLTSKIVHLNVASVGDLI